MSRHFVLALLVAGAVLALACGHSGRRDPGEAPKHHSPRPVPSTRWATPMPHPKLQTAQQPAPR